jgi:NTE family protein
MFGAWQAGAWQVLQEHFQPDLVIGASIGSLNGYAIASGLSADDLIHYWRQPQEVGFEHLRATVGRMLTLPLKIDYGVAIVDALRLKPRIIVAGPGYPGQSVRPEHIMASCAVPLAFAPVKIDGRFYIDGGIVNALPIYAAVDLGATEIIGLHVLPNFPSTVMRPFVRGFFKIFGHFPPPPADVSLRVIKPSRDLGSLRDALVWDPARTECWLEMGSIDTRNALVSRPDGSGR